ncbi:MAG: TIGR00266 family protein [Alicyclobacillus sp. RIFOXYA1_FULL_53_8]|nr:MAG: TIGR00266 family protein [Alicyclobacillus sp. RIFOXYA1_FULL_53_8]
MNYEIHGTTMQSLSITLDGADDLVSEAGCLLYMTPEIELQTEFLGGVGGVMKRAFTGNSMTINRYRNRQSSRQTVAFSTRMPGHIIPVEVHPARPVYVQKHSFLCCESTVNLEVAGYFNLAGIFGGNGILMTRLEGHGQAFISVDGESLAKDLSHGESLLVHPAHVAAYEGTVNYEVVRMKGLKNMFFGGDGLALVKLTGPGRAWLHTLNIRQLATELAEVEDGNSGAVKGGLIGGIIGDLFK